MSKSFGVLFLLFCTTALSLSAAQPFAVTNRDGLRYEAALASSVVAPEPFLTLAFGKGDDQVGGSDEDTQKTTEGIPMAWRPQADGSVWVLDAIHQKLKHFAPNGKLMGVISYEGLNPGGYAMVRDFCPAPSDGFYLVCTTDGKIYRIDAKGKPVVEIEGLADTRVVGTDPQGNLLLNNPVVNGVMRFGPDGVLIEKYEGALDLTPFTDLEGRPYGTRMAENQVVLFKALTASPSVETDLATFSLEVPAERKAHFVSGKVVGVDAAWNVYVELIATDDDGVIHFQRVFKLDPQGKTLSTFDIHYIPHLAPDLPRQLTVGPDGKLLSFYTDEKNWILGRYSLK